MKNFRDAWAPEPWETLQIQSNKKNANNRPGRERVFYESRCTERLYMKKCYIISGASFGAYNGGPRSPDRKRK